jgi:signal peptidase I
LTSDGGHYIFAPGEMTPRQVLEENMRAMIQTAKKLSLYLRTTIYKDQMRKRLLQLLIKCFKDDSQENWSITDFFLPKLNWRFFLRLGIVILVCVLLFSYILEPCLIKGRSMEPTYPAVGFTFCNRLAYRNKLPERGDIIILKYAAKKLLLKRVIALPGETIEIRDGIVYVDNKKLDEPYVKKRNNEWFLRPRKVEKNKIYVIGDNRSMPSDKHIFGQISTKRIHGAPLW